MNKRQREIKMSIAELNRDVDKALEAGNADEAGKLLDKVDELQKEYDVIARAEGAKKLTVTEDNTAEAGTGAEDEAARGKCLNIMGVQVSEKSVHDFAKAFREGFPKSKSMNEGTNADGGYTVPQDIVTLVERFRDAKASLRSLIRVENVRTNTGRRTFQTRAQQTGFAKVSEGAKIPKKAGPKFTVIEYAIEKFGGWLAITNELIEDSDADILMIVAEWLGDEARITDNINILNELYTADAVDFEDLDDLTYAFDVTLGQAFAGTSAIITNDSGKHWLNTLKDGTGRYILQPNPTEPNKPQIAAGANVIPLMVLPNADMPNEVIYELTTDTDVVAGKTYYTRSGSGTSESPYVYTAVQSPQQASLGSYYEKFAGVPMLVGDLHDAVIMFDRRQLTLKTSDVATAGVSDEAVNAFDEDLTLVRGTMREDVVSRDSAAVVRGRVILPD